MKIKSYGKVKPWSLDVSCDGEKGCGAVLTLEKPHDLGVIQMRRTRNDYFYCICPLCGHEIEVPAEDIREDIRDAIE